MFSSYTTQQLDAYRDARETILREPTILINIEKYLSKKLFDILRTKGAEIYSDYDEASFLYPFWKNYPPEDRGRMPRGDQFPWIEVGEHVIGVKIARAMADHFTEVKDTGLPTGPDQRFVVADSQIKHYSKGLTSYAWLMIDIKSAGPRDDFDHAVMSHNQVSGNGVWKTAKEGVSNKRLRAYGARSKHEFYPALPPLYVLSNGIIAPTITIVVKPVYKMLSLESHGDIGQPLERIDLATIPNGMLLSENPCYLKKHPMLFYPGKDDKGKNPLKLRVRVSFPILSEIATWRVKAFAIKMTEM